MQWVSLPYHMPAKLFSLAWRWCTEQHWLESQEAQNLPALQAPIMQGTGAFLVVFTFRSAGYVHRIDSVGEVF